MSNPSYSFINGCRKVGTWLRTGAMTVSPLALSCMASSWPIPLLAPVTTTTATITLLRMVAMWQSKLNRATLQSFQTSNSTVGLLLMPHFERFRATRRRPVHQWPQCNGLIDNYLYYSGQVDTSLAFEELRRRSLINEAA